MRESYRSWSAVVVHREEREPRCREREEHESIVVAGPLDELLEDGVVNDVGADEVATARLADVAGVEVSGDLVVVVVERGGVLIVGGRDGLRTRRWRRRSRRRWSGC